MTKIKICGLTRLEDMEAVNRLGPDYIGFVFAESRRKVTPQQAQRLKAELDYRIKSVGVFTNESVEFITAICDAGTIDMVQLHGNETETYLLELKQKITCPIMKAVRVQNTEQIRMEANSGCDFLLLDTWKNGQYGGSGKMFDHDLIPELKKPFFLAGGLSSANISQAILGCTPYGVDVSSGVETDGIKDQVKMKRFIKTIRDMG